MRRCYARPLALCVVLLAASLAASVHRDQRARNSARDGTALSYVDWGGVDDGMEAADAAVDPTALALDDDDDQMSFKTAKPSKPNAKPKASGGASAQSVSQSGELASNPKEAPSGDSSDAPSAASSALSPSSASANQAQAGRSGASAATGSASATASAAAAPGDTPQPESEAARSASKPGSAASGAKPENNNAASVTGSSAVETLPKSAGQKDGGASGSAGQEEKGRHGSIEAAAARREEKAGGSSAAKSGETRAASGASAEKSGSETKTKTKTKSGGKGGATGNSNQAGSDSRATKQSKQKAVAPAGSKKAGKPKSSSARGLLRRQELQSLNLTRSQVEAVLRLEDQALATRRTVEERRFLVFENALAIKDSPIVESRALAKFLVTPYVAREVQRRQLEVSVIRRLQLEQGVIESLSESKLDPPSTNAELYRELRIPEQTVREIQEAEEEAVRYRAGQEAERKHARFQTLIQHARPGPVLPDEDLRSVGVEDKNLKRVQDEEQDRGFERIVTDVVSRTSAASLARPGSVLLSRPAFLASRLGMDQQQIRKLHARERAALLALHERDAAERRELRAMLQARGSPILSGAKLRSFNLTKEMVREVQKHEEDVARSRWIRACRGVLQRQTAEQNLPAVVARDLQSLKLSREQAAEALKMSEERVAERRMQELRVKTDESHNIDRDARILPLLSERQLRALQLSEQAAMEIMKMEEDALRNRVVHEHVQKGPAAPQTGARPVRNTTSKPSAVKPKSLEEELLEKFQLSEEQLERIRKLQAAAKAKQRSQELDQLASRADAQRQLALAQAEAERNAERAKERAWFASVMAQRAAALKSDAPKSKVQAAVRKVDAQLAEAEARREQERAKAAEQLRTKLQQAEEKRLILAKIAEQNAAAEAERRRIEFERHPLVTPPLPPLSPDDIIFT